MMVAHGFGTDTDVLVTVLFERKGIRTRAAQPEVFHPSHHLAVLGRSQGIGQVKDENTAFTEVMKRLTAFGIGAVVHHGNLRYGAR
jgi:hypothetical protein